MTVRSWYENPPDEKAAAAAAAAAKKKAREEKDKDDDANDDSKSVQTNEQTTTTSNGDVITSPNATGAAASSSLGLGENMDETKDGEAEGDEENDEEAVGESNSNTFADGDYIEVITEELVATKARGKKRKLKEGEVAVPRPPKMMIKKTVTRRLSEAALATRKARRQAEGRGLINITDLPATSPSDDITTKLTKQPSCITNGNLRHYQLDGLNWLISRHDHAVGGILADEMGLGKTLQTVSFLGYLKHERGIHGPHLVVAPLGVLGSWMREFKFWCPTLRVVRFHGPANERKRLQRDALVPGKFDVVVTTFETVCWHSVHTRPSVVLTF
jgi:hypothetical protein